MIPIYDRRLPKLQITTPGRANGVVVGFQIHELDYVASPFNVTITTSDSKLTIENKALITAPITIGTAVYQAKQAIVFDLIADSGIRVRDAYLTVTWTTAGGASGTGIFDVKVYTAMPPLNIDPRTIPLGIGLSSTTFANIPVGAALPAMASYVGQLFIKTGTNAGLYWALDLVGNWEGPLSG